MSNILHWFVRNSVTSNLLMLVIIVGGLLSIPEIRTQIFPPLKLNAVDISVQYDGASPDIVTKNISIPVENSLKDLRDIKNIYSFAVQGHGTTTVFFYANADIDQKLSEIKRRIDGLSSLPKATERPVVKRTTENDRILDIAIHGNVELETLTLVGERVRNTLLRETSVSKIKLFSAPPREIVIEVPSRELRRTGLSLQDISTALKQSSVDIPGGVIGDGSNQISIRGNNRAYRPQEFGSIPILNKVTGEKLNLGEIAEIKYGRKDINFSSRFNGKVSAGLEVFISPDQDLLSIRDEIAEKLKVISETLPQEIEITIWLDDSKDIAQRLEMLLDNAITGLCLVFVVLVLFLDLKLAFWVCTGIAISFTGGIWLLPTFDVSLNHLSTFAFLLILGIVVDDAIVVGESIYQKQEKYGFGIRAAYEGVNDVWKPVFLGVLTTVAAAVPGLLFKSIIGSFLYDISLIIVVVLAFSLIESLLILPCHLVTTDKAKKKVSYLVTLIDMPRAKFQKFLQKLIYRYYHSLLKTVLAWRYMTLSVFLSIAIFSIGLVFSGRVPMQIFPNMTEGQIVASIAMNRGVAKEHVTQTMLQLENSFDAMLSRLLENQSSLNDTETQSVFVKNRASFISDNDIFMIVELNGEALSEIPIDLMVSKWQEEFGVIPDAKKIDFSSSENGDPNTLSLKIFGQNSLEINEHIEELKHKALSIAGVYNFTVVQGKPTDEFLIDLRPEGLRLGLNLAGVSAQLSEAFYGTRVDRIPGYMETTDVNIRLPKEERLYSENVERFPLSVDGDKVVPFMAVADLKRSQTPSYIERINGRQTATVDIHFDKTSWTRFELLGLFENEIIPKIKLELHNFDYKLDGDAEEEDEFTAESLNLYLIFLFIIYAILAIGSNSYLLPFIILTAAPFGLVGAIWGHDLFAMEVNAFSIMGVLAAAGVVINDNLVLIDRINKLKERGFTISQAIFHGCLSRFRPIVLTSLTTFLGLLPILFEGSYQAQFVIPMAISLAFGVLLATFVTLLLIPALYKIGLDISRVFSFIRTEDPIDTAVSSSVSHES